MWRPVYADLFLRDLARLPKSVQERIEAIVYGEAVLSDPFLSGKTQPLEGHKGYYKIRVGDYRIGVRLDFNGKIIQFDRVRHRKDIYRYFP